MPVCKWLIEPSNLVCTNNSTTFDHYPKEFTEISNEIYSNLIRQLSSLSKHAEDLFKELNLQTSDICGRSIRLISKVNHLKDISVRLNPTADKVSLDDIILRKPFKSGLQRHIHGMGRPDAIVEAYSKLEPMPDIHVLNRFKGENEVDCTKLYSDPNFFFMSWCGQIKQEVDKKPSRKKAPAKRKAEVTRKPQNLNLRRIQERVKNEIIGGVSKTNRPESSPQDGLKASSKERLSQLSNFSKSSNLSTQEKSQFDSESIESNQLMIIPPPPLPLPNQLIENMEGDPVEDLNLPPPPPPLDVEKRGTLYMVEDFSPDFLILPAPPPSHMFQPRSQNSSHSENFPQLSPTMPPIPPPLSPKMEPHQPNTDPDTSLTFADMINNNAFKLKSVDSNPDKNAVGSVVARQSSSGKGDSRNDLLSAIRNGIKLRKVDEVRQEVKVHSQEGVAGMFDVQTIMEMRRRALQDDDDGDDDDDYDSECSWDE